MAAKSRRRRKRRKVYTDIRTKMFMGLLLVGICVVLAGVISIVKKPGGDSFVDTMIEKRMRSEARRRLEQLAPNGQVTDQQVDSAVQAYKQIGGRIPQEMLEQADPQDIKRALKARGFSDQDIQRAKGMVGR